MPTVLQTANPSETMITEVSFRSPMILAEVLVAIKERKKATYNENAEQLHDSRLHVLLAVEQRVDHRRERRTRRDQLGGRVAEALDFHAAAKDHQATELGTNTDHV